MPIWKSTLATKSVTRKLVLEGTREIMFDRYAGDNQTKLKPHQKFYFDPTRTDNALVIPAVNVMSFLSAHNTNSAPKRLRDARKYKNTANACLSFVSIPQSYIPFTRNGKPICFGEFVNDKDAASGAYVHRAVARLDKGVPNPKERPVLPLPWALEFDITIQANGEITEQEIFNLLDEGGRAIGLGTFRGVFGKFIIKSVD